MAGCAFWSSSATAIFVVPLLAWRSDSWASRRFCAPPMSLLVLMGPRAVRADSMPSMASTLAVRQSRGAAVRGTSGTARV
ncbi:hypothetical protein B0H16DRAFT_1545367 [Mycena metata]|uniref:Secreted protein n=1 Tax=Mycena metata TaxID=1033252 RepID=A0AAD7J288_9AGAR|nr:hypothetical protein B0H16DRAFT_1545367 [Mycena metata]